MDVLAYANRRQQFVYAPSAVPASFVATAMYFRIDPVLIPKPGSSWADLEIRCGHAATLPSTVSGSFAANVSGAAVRVIAVDSNRVVVTAHSDSPAGTA